MQPQSFKVCPSCGAPCHTGALECDRCGHAFRIQFSSPYPQTQQNGPTPHFSVKSLKSHNEKNIRLWKSIAIVSAILIAAVFGYPVLKMTGILHPDRPTVSLIEAAHVGNMEQLEANVYWGCDVNAEDAGGDTPIREAIFSHHLQAVQFLIEKGVSARYQTNQELSPLHLAAIAGDADIAKFLIDKGAEINVLDDGERGTGPVGDAKNLEVLKVLIDHGAILHGAPEQSAIYSAIEHGRLDMVKFIIEQGMDVNTYMRGGTPLMIATEWKQDAVVDYLIGKGAHPLTAQEVEMARRSYNLMHTNFGQ